MIGRALDRRTGLDLYDYESLLDITGDHVVTEVEVHERDWLAERPIGDLVSPEEGVLVLAVHRSERKYLGAPSADVVVEPGDVMIVYGRADVICDVGLRATSPQRLS